VAKSIFRRSWSTFETQGLTISGYGTVNLINTALYVHDLDQGVIGEGSLDKRGAYTGIYNGKLIVYDRTGEVILTATNRNNLLFRWCIQRYIIWYRMTTSLWHIWWYNGC
jgi:hypothetical protein